jgi:hypothetical protein
MKRINTLYKRTSKGQMQQWSIFVDGPSYIIEEGIVGGKLTTTKPHICEAKNVGKTNETSAEQQAEKEAEAEATRKLKRGYVLNMSDVDSTEFEKPMKGDTWEDRCNEVVFPVLVGDKLNGVRVRINKTRAFSTGGETFYTIPHIIEELAPIYKEYPNLFLDGEGFNYELRENLNRLIKLVSVQIKAKDVTEELLTESKRIVRFHCFDGYGFNDITKETPYIKRLTAIQKLLSKYNLNYTIVENVKEVKSAKEIPQLVKENKAKKGEGLMIRWGDCPYKNGRSKYMLKLKHFYDAEYEILDLEEGNADWSGAAKRAVMKLAQPAPDGTKTFNANILGSYEELAKMLKDVKKIRGKMGTLSYQNISEYGIPILPWLIAVRDYE